MPSAFERELDRFRARPGGGLATAGRATRQRNPGTLALREAQSRAARAKAGQRAASESATEPASSFRLESQQSQGSGPGLPVGTKTDGRIVTIPDYVPGGDLNGKNTDLSTFGLDPDPYPVVLPSLSAEQLGQLAERRRIADQRLKQAENEMGFRQPLLEAASERARQSADRTGRRALEDFMREAGGKGLARSPMVAGRQVRRSGEDLRLAYGEIDTRLSNEILTLQNMVSQASDERNSIIAGIEQQRVNMQTDLERLFPAASTVR